MKSSGDWLRQQIAGGLVMLLAMPFGEAATVQPQQAAPTQQTEGASPVSAQPQSSDRPISNPDAGETQPQVAPGTPDPAPIQAADQDQPSGNLQPTPEQPQDQTSKPVGTAAAPYEKTTGVPASRPAGAVIAPAKQRRSRSILIRVAVVIGAAVAVGTVVALSKASPSRPH